MNNHKNELHSVGIRDITSPFSNEFHEERMWVCLNIVDETRETPP
jgi:hypothetical protein